MTKADLVQEISNKIKKAGINRFFWYLCIPKRKVETLETFPSILKSRIQHTHAVPAFNHITFKV